VRLFSTLSRQSTLYRSQHRRPVGRTWNPPLGFGDIYSVQLSVTPTVERTCVTDTCSSFSLRISFHSVSLEQHQTIRLSPQRGLTGLCSWAPPFFLRSYHSVRSHRPSSRAVPGLQLGACPRLTPSCCLLREIGMPCFSPTSQRRPLSPSRGPALSWSP